MTRFVLLPRAEKEENDWHQDDPIFSLKSGVIRDNLAPPKWLNAEGIPSPWAARDYMLWRLEDQQSDKGQEAQRILRTLLVLQFLRLIVGEELTLSEGPEGIERLARVLLRPAHAPDQKITVWRSTLPELKKYRVVAGSVASCPFFVAASVDPADLRRALVNAVGPNSQSPLVDDNCHVIDSNLAGALAGYIGRLGAATRKISDRATDFANALDTWQKELESFGTTTTPTSRLSILLGEPSGPQAQFEAWSGSNSWNCPACQLAGRGWTDPLPNQSISGKPIARVKIDSCQIMCPRHPLLAVRSNNGSGDPIGYADLGCYPADQLYVWNEEAAFPINRTSYPQIGDGFIEHQFNVFRIRIEGTLLKLGDVILEPDVVAWPSRGSSRTAEGKEVRESQIPVDVPVRAEYAFLVKDCKFDSPASRGWLLSLHGYPGELLRSVPAAPSSKLWETSTILVWPPRELERWGLDYVVASSPLSERLRFRIVKQRLNNLRFEVSEPCMLLAIYRTEGARVRYVELGEIGSGKYVPLGLMKVNREKISRVNGPQAQVVVDFGTSNSAVLWQLSDQQPQFLRSGIPEATLPANAYQVTYSASERIQLENAAAVLLSWYPEALSQPFVPALLAEPEIDTARAQPCIPPRKEGVAILRQSGKDLETSRVRVGLKWREWTNPATRTRVRKLLEALFVPALWKRVAHRSGALSSRCSTVVWTTPLPLP